MRTGSRERLAGVRAYATVSGEVFDRADLSSVCLDRVRLDRCSLVAADLRQATLDRCNFKFCDLRRALLRGASLRFAKLAGCDLREADLRDCDLTGASFGYVNTGAPNGLSDLTGVVMDGAVLTGATFERVVGWPPRDADARGHPRAQPGLMAAASLGWQDSRLRERWPRVTQSIDQKASAAASATDEWLSAFQAALTAREAETAAALFAEESYWRDIISFTWNITTVEGRAGVADLLRATLDEVDPVGFRVSEEPTEADGVITAWIAFETRAGRGSGLLRLIGGQAFTLLTTLDELSGHEEPVNQRRAKGVRHGAFRDRATWAESRAREEAELGYTVQPEVLIIGGGQGGIALGARLRQLGVPTIIVERNERPGDSWRNRYKSLALHDPVWYDHLPYLPFPASWPVFSPKDKIGDWLEMYAKVMELNYWGSTTCKSAVRDGDGWASCRPGTARRSRSGPGSWCSRWERPGCPASPRSPAGRSSAATSTTPPLTRAPIGTRASGPS